MKLHLGIIDLPYSDRPESETTVKVAELLEEKYGVMQKFYDIHGGDIAADIADGIAGALENIIAGKKNANLFAGAMSKTEKRFRGYIDNQEHGIHLKKMEPGQAKAGARKKRQYKRVKETTAFVDSGLYRKMFRSWIEE